MRPQFLVLVIVVFFAWMIHGCKEEVEPPLDCSQLTLTVTGTSEVSSCGEDDGGVQVTASGGVEPYVYELNVVTSSSGAFTGLKAGVYQVKVNGGNGDCSADAVVMIATEGSDLVATATATSSSVCPPASNGFVTVNSSSGVLPYEYKLGIRPFVSENVLTDLAKGIYSVEVRDAEGCSFFLTVEVPGMQYATIQSLIELNCATANCHDGSLGAQSDYTRFENVKENSNAIRTLTGNKSMPPNGNLSQEQIDLIACWVADGANQ